MNEKSDLPDRKTTVVVTCMGPERRDLLDRALKEWKKLRDSSPRQHVPTEEEESAVYSFAYWLFRYSGLVKPTKAPRAR